MKLGDLFLFGGLSLSSVYLWTSGLPQISHILLLLLAGFTLLQSRKHHAATAIKLLLAFCCLALTVNLVYFAIYNDSLFVFSAAQNFYNAILFAGMSAYLAGSQGSLKVTSLALLAGQAIQWGVYFAGLGNWQLYPRYAGTFNDPNQMAFWVIATTASYLILNGLKLSFGSLCITASGIGLVMLTISRSALVAVAACVILLLGRVAWRQLRTRFGLAKLLLLGGALGAIVPLVAVERLRGSEGDVELFQRVVATDLLGQADERGYSRFSEFPEYILFGSGQGAHSRFNQTKPPEFLNVEMHTTWGGILHYYGVAGFALVIAFIAVVARRAGAPENILLFSTFVYGLSTYSFRTPIFWVLLAIVSLPVVRSRRRGDLKLQAHQQRFETATTSGKLP